METITLRHGFNGYYQGYLLGQDKNNFYIEEYGKTRVVPRLFTRRIA